jgi:DNA-binding winged helix-turn-helix (wHTH) protein
VLGSDAKQVIRFATFEVDPHARELRRDGSRVKLQEQPFQVLLALLERPGDVITRELLRAKLWPADTFVDFDHSLNAAVKRLRDALGDTAENPRFIETLARRGYRFLVPLHGQAVTPSPAVPTPVLPAPTHVPAAADGLTSAVPLAARAARWWPSKSARLGLGILASVIAVLIAFNIGTWRTTLARWSWRATDRISGSASREELLWRPTPGVLCGRL